VALGIAVLIGVPGVLAPTTAGAAPGTAAEAGAQLRETAQRLTVLDEQVHEAELTVAAQQEAAAAAAEQAAAAQAALAVYEPQLRAIAQSGYTGKSQSRVAAFLTSDSADELVQQMTTLDMIADHTETVVARSAAAQHKADAAHAAAAAAKATAAAGLTELKKQKAQMQAKVDQYKAAFARLSAREQAAVTTRVAGRALARPSFASLGLDPQATTSIAIKTALSKVGSPYVYGATGPNAFDCSGLTGYAYAAAGIRLPRSSGEQAGVGTPVSRSELKPGDLVFFYSPISHVGLYIGDGKMVHARTEGQPVAVTSVDQAGYNMAVRVVA
jgi:cell wall-associated NlpC family hydrolase